MNTNRLPPLLALARDWRAEDTGLAWREAAWCHALLLRGHHHTAIAWLAATAAARAGPSDSASRPSPVGGGVEAVAVALLRSLRAG